MIYFIHCSISNLVKIGYSKNPTQRFIGLQHSCPVSLELLGFVDGDHAMESRMHTFFFPFHERGEWFRWEGRLADEVSAILTDKFDYSRLPEKGLRSWALAARASGKPLLNNGRRRRNFDLPDAAKQAA